MSMNSATESYSQPEPQNVQGGQSSSSLTSLIHKVASNDKTGWKEKEKVDLRDLDVSSPNAQSYLSSLSSLSLSTIQSQPDQFKEISTSLESQLSDLCLKHVDSFIQVHNSIQSLTSNSNSNSNSNLPSSTSTSNDHPESSSSTSTLSDISSSLSSILNSHLPNLDSLSNQFKSNTSPSLANRNKALNLKEHYSGVYTSSNESSRGGGGGGAGLHDLLELPRLVETCILAKHYHEALKLGVHIAKLSSDPSTSKEKAEGVYQDPVLISLKEETWNHFHRMRKDLLETLKRPEIKMSTVKRTLVYLRKLQELDVASGSRSKGSSLGIAEAQLCLVFLRSRFSNLKRSLEELTSSQTKSKQARGIEQITNYLKSFIDSWRESVSETCSLAMSLFVDSNTSSETIANSKGLNESPSPLLLISSFSAHSFTILKQVLEIEIPSLVPNPSSYSSNYDYSKSLELSANSLSTLFTQLSFVSANLGRIGLDFSQLLGIGIQSKVSMDNQGPFVKTLLSLFSIPIANSTDELVNLLSNATSLDQESFPASIFLSTNSRTSKTKTIQKLLQLGLSSFSTMNSPNDMFNPSSNSKNNPLIQFSPLISYLNSLISSFNALRLFPLFSVKGSALQTLISSFKSIIKALDNYKIDLEERLNEFFEDSSRRNLKWDWDLPSFDLSEDSKLYLSKSTSNINSDSNLLKRRAEIEFSILSRAIILFTENLIPWLLNGLNNGIYSDSKILTPEEVGLLGITELNKWAREIETQRSRNEEERKEEVEKGVRSGREKEELQRQENERLEIERQRLENEQLEKERIERERLEQERVEKERLEVERLKKEREVSQLEEEKKKFEKERLERERIEKEKAEAQRLEQEALEKSERERKEKERVEAEQAEQERKAAALKKEADQLQLDKEKEATQRKEATNPSSEIQVSPSQPTSSTSDSTLPSNSASPATEPQPPVNKKLSLADKLKLRAEEREQAKLAAQAKAESEAQIKSSSVDASEASPNVEAPQVESNLDEVETDETLQATSSPVQQPEPVSAVPEEIQEEGEGEHDSNEAESTNPSRAPSEVDGDEVNQGEGEKDGGEKQQVKGAKGKKKKKKGKK